MTLEGSRKFLVMWVGLIGTWVLAKYGPEWGGIWNSAITIALPALASGLYFLINYLQKTTKDVFVPENWLSGKRIMFGLLATIIAPLITGWSTELKDAASQTATLLSDILLPVVYMIFQGLSDRKLKANETAAITVTAVTPVSATTTLPAITPISTAPATAETVPVPVFRTTVKERKAIARKTYGTWEGAKQLLLGTFKESFEAALRRLVRLNPNIKTIDAARAAILEIVGVNLDDKACEAFGQIPGFLGAVGANAQITIISDMITAIDRTPELEYLKKQFMVRALYYAVKEVVDQTSKRITDGLNKYTADGLEEAKLALEEFGFTRWQIDKSFRDASAGGQLQKIWYSPTGEKDTYQYVDWDPWRFAGVNIESPSLEDL